MRTQMNRWGLLAGFALLAMMGCDDADDGIDGGADTIDIVGTWVDPFATQHVITETEWTQTAAGDTSVYAISTFDRTSMLIIAENGADNGFNPGKFSRFDWTQLNDRLFFCQSVFDADTADAAANAEGANPADPETTGCGGDFPWSELLVP